MRMAGGLCLASFYFSKAGHGPASPIQRKSNGTTTGISFLTRYRNHNHGMMTDHQNPSLIHKCVRATNNFMTPIFRISLLMLTQALFVGSAWSQPAIAASDLGTKNLDDLKQIADKLVGGSDAEAFTQAAYASKRLDFLEVCWATPVCNGWFLDQLEVSGDREFRDRLVLMMLRCSNPKAWPMDAGGLMGGAQDVIASIMRRLMRDHLPDLPPGYDIMSSLERRRKLAGRFEAAIQQKRDHAAEPAPEKTSTPVPESAMPTAVPSSKVKVSVP